MTVADEQPAGLHLDLLANAHDFVNESLRNLQRALDETMGPIKFAVIHLAQAIELMLKERLRREHDVLVYRKIERGTTTVNLDEALLRLERCGVDLSPKDVKGVRTARDLRNELMHFEVSATEGQLYAAYVTMLEFAVVFHQHELGTELHEAVDRELQGLHADVMAVFDRDVVVFHGETVVKTYPAELLKAQVVIYYVIDGAIYPRIPCGDDEDLLPLAGNGTRCGDCSALVGQQHALLCDGERCPRCRRQWLACDCMDESLGKGDERPQTA